MTTERSGMSLEHTSKEVLAIRQKLKSGEYDGVTIMHAWLMLDAYAEHLSRDAVVSDFPMGAIENGRVFADRVENTDLSCVAGDLHLCVDWHEFRRCFEHLANWALTESFAARHAAVPGVPSDSQCPTWLSGSRDRLLYMAGFKACRKAMLAQRDGG